MSQGSLILPTTGTLSGLTLVQLVNAAHANLASLASGATDPATLSGGVQPFSLWLDLSVTPNALRMRNAANNGWAAMGTISGNNFVPDLQSSDITAALGFTPVSESGSYANPSWLTSLAGSKISGDIAGNAGSVTNGVYTNGSYANPAWITSLAGSKISGTVANATTAANGGVTSVDSTTGAITLANLASFAKSLANSGYQKLPSGLILQWGRGTFVGGDAGLQTVTFPTAFPNACLNGSATVFVAAQTYAIGVDNLSATSMRLGLSYQTPPPFMWIAIGY